MLPPFGCGGQLPHPLKGAKKYPIKPIKKIFLLEKTTPAGS
jgi:hypothetical protein